jgi:hypothetical protein
MWSRLTKDVWGRFCCHVAPPTNRPVSWRACLAWLRLMAFATFSCRFIVVHVSPTTSWELKVTTHRSSCRWKAYIRHCATRCLEGIVCTLVSPPQCHAAFGTIPHTLALEGCSHVRRPVKLPPSATRTPKVGFWRDIFIVTLVGSEIYKSSVIFFGSNKYM